MCVVLDVKLNINGINYVIMLVVAFVI